VTDRSAARRELLATLGLTLLAAIALFVAASARWAHGIGRRPAGSSYVVVRASVSGHTVAGIVEAAALLALVGAVAVPATRGRGRLAMGVLLVLGGVAGMVGAVRSRDDARGHVLHALPAGATVVTDPWWLLAAFGAALLAVAGVILASRGPRWSSLSARYDAPTARREKVVAGDAHTWDALDRGEDPTA
jgi:uncharacterized membrane protein (TIGR02234 family)